MPKGRHYTRGGWIERGSGDSGWWLGGQIGLQFLEHQLELGFRLGIASEHQLAAVGGWQMHVDHLHGGELLKYAARRQPWRQGVQAARQGDVQTIGQEGDEDRRAPRAGERSAGSRDRP